MSSAVGESPARVQPCPVQAAPARPRPARTRLPAAGGNDALRVARNLTRWTMITVLVLALALDAGRAADEFLTEPSWSAAGRSTWHGVELTVPWIAEAGLILTLIFRGRRTGLALGALVLLILAAEPMAHCASFAAIPGSGRDGHRFYLLYLATALAVFPVFYRRSPRHRRPIAAD